MDGLFDGFTSFTCALLNPTIEFFLFTFDILQVIVREFRPLLFQLALGNVPIAFDFECCHDVSLFVFSTLPPA